MIGEEVARSGESGTAVLLDWRLSDCRLAERKQISVKSSTYLNKKSLKITKV